MQKATCLGSLFALIYNEELSLKTVSSIVIITVVVLGYTLVIAVTPVTVLVLSILTVVVTSIIVMTISLSQTVIILVVSGLSVIPAAAIKMLVISTPVIKTLVVVTAVVVKMLTVAAPVIKTVVVIICVPVVAIIKTHAEIIMVTGYVSVEPLVSGAIEIVVHIRAGFTYFDPAGSIPPVKIMVYTR